MNAKELRQAAENILHCDCECDSYHGYACFKCTTLKPLAYHILATVRDDDGEDITEDWFNAYSEYRDGTIEVND